MTDTETTLTVAVDADIAPLKTQLDQAGKLGQQFGTSLSRAFVGLALEGRSLADVVRGIGLSLSRLALDAALKPVGQSVGNALSGLFASVAGTGVGFARGGVLPAGTPTPFASGGVIASPVAFPLGRGLGVAGERGAEAILPLARGPDGRLGVAASGAARPIAVTLNVTTPDAESFRRSEAQLSALLARAVAQGHRSL